MVQFHVKFNVTNKHAQLLQGSFSLHRPGAQEAGQKRQKGRRCLAWYGFLWHARGEVSEVPPVLKTCSTRREDVGFGNLKGDEEGFVLSRPSGFPEARC